MSYGRAGAGFGIAEGLDAFGRALARISAGRAQEERQEALDQRYQDELQYNRQRDMVGLLSTPGVTRERPSVDFEVPGMRGMMSGAQMPNMQVSKPISGVNEARLGDETLYVEPGYSQRQSRIEERRAQREAEQRNRSAYESIPNDLRGDIGDFNPNADYGAVPNMIVERRLAGSATQPGIRTVDAGDRTEIIRGDTGALVREIPHGQAPRGSVSGMPDVPESARKLYGFQQTGLGALDRLEGIIESSGVPNIGANAASGTRMGRYVVSPEVQQFRQNAENLLVSILRPETGAAITDTEFERYMQVYIPQPGDAPETIRAKLDAAREKLHSITAGLPPIGNTQTPASGGFDPEAWYQEGREGQESR